MRTRPLLRGALIAALALLAGGMPGTERSRSAAAFNQAPGRNSVSTRGGWSHVIAINDDWLVLQDEERRQFPIRFSEVKLFIMRWPILLNEVSPGGLLESYGRVLASSGLESDHIDVYEGTDRSLAQSASVPYYNLGRFVLFDGASGVYSPSTLPFTLNLFPTIPQPSTVSGFNRVVGSLAGVDPIVIAYGGNQSSIIQPAETGLTVTQVTRGNPAMVERGDLVYFVPSAAGPKALELNLLLVYKSMTLNMFKQRMLQAPGAAPAPPAPPRRRPRAGAK